MSNYLTKIVILVAVLLSSVSFLYTQEDQFLKNVRKNMENKKKEAANLSSDEKKLDGILLHLVRWAETADTSQNNRAKQADLLQHDKDLHADARGMISVNLILGSRRDTTSVVMLVRSLNGEIEQVGLVPFIRCRIYPKSLRSLISNSSIIRIEHLSRGRSKNIISAGDGQLNADKVRQQYSALGSGVRVGVISDGVKNISDVQAAGELPAVTVVRDGTSPPPAPESENEGTAMLEIVHDLAPSASLYFYSDDDDYTNVANGIATLTAPPYQCKVIVDDVQGFTEPFFTDEDNILGAAIHNFFSAGGTLISVAGNENYDIDNPNAHMVYSGHTDFPTDINRFAGGLDYLEVEVPANSSGAIYFQWATPWTNPVDLNINVYDEYGTEKGAATDAHQGANMPPRESVFLSNTLPGATDRVWRTVITDQSGGGPGTDFKIVCPVKPGVTLKLRNSFTDNKHTFGHSGYPGVIGVAAYSASLPTQMTKYSSWGPLTMYSTAMGTWIEQPTPLITATSGVSTYVGSQAFWKDDQGVNIEPYNGTSAAAPHIAGIAALYFSKWSQRTRVDFINDLTTSAADIYSTSGNLLSGGLWHQQSGYGKANALACFQRADIINSGAPEFTPAPCIAGTPGCGTSSRIEVTLRTSIAGADIWYTLDGFTEPTNNPSNGSQIYSGTAIPLTSTTTIKAAAFNGSFRSPTTTGTYHFGGQASITINSISPTQIGVGQTTVATTITFTRQLQYPNGSGCPQHDGNELDAWIDGTIRASWPDNYTQTDFQFSVVLNEGHHTINITQEEVHTCQDNCSACSHWSLPRC
jgi:hypothetical protein